MVELMGLVDGMYVGFGLRKWVRDDKEEKSNRLLGLRRRLKSSSRCYVRLAMSIRHGNAIVISSFKSRGEIWAGNNQIE